jgi:uncharacterized protein YggU (UPF0235/DUF167 family)
MLLSVRVRPGSRRQQVGGRYGSSEPPVLVVRVTAPATDNRANAAVRSALARAFGVPASAVRIRTGHAHRSKIIEVDGAERGRLHELLAAGDPDAPLDPDDLRPGPDA